MGRIRTMIAAAVASALLAMSMVLGATPASAAAQCGSFDDVRPSNPFCHDIAWLSAHHIAEGYSDGGFHPRATVTRQAMAAFLYRLANPGADERDCGYLAPFGDVDPDSPFCGDVGWLAAEGVTGGYSDGGFRPRATVTRQAMAAFLHRLAQPVARTKRCTSRPFDDVPKGNPFCADIAWLVGKNIAHGYDDGGFHPKATVTRQAMAAFLHRLDPDMALRSPYTVYGDGTYRVGTDIKPGTYRTRWASATCYWERRSSATAIVATGAPEVPAVVTIEKSDKQFHTRGCGLWTNNLSQLTTSRTRHIGEGIWIVGTDILPGTYRTRRGVSGHRCQWSRLGGFSGERSDRIASGNPAGPEVVTIKATDKGFHTKGCAPWTTDLSQVTASKTTGVGNGTWIVGTDMKPGTWRNSGGAACHWQRMSGFSGQLGATITEGYPSGSVTVSVKQSDAGFSTDGCGKWHRVS